MVVEVLDGGDGCWVVYVLTGGNRNTRENGWLNNNSRLYCRKRHALRDKSYFGSEWSNAL